MGHRKEKYLKRVRQQLVNKHENKVYYQNGTEWQSDSTEGQVQARRKVQP